ncbi:MAG TPA: hypothetical protein VIX80_07305 [Candidatus Kapabacteria bacterium]
MKQRILSSFALLAIVGLFFAGDVFAQAVPSLVSQQMRLSTGGISPNYVQHRAIISSPVAPGTNGWYAWDQVPTATTGINYLLFLNDLNEVRRTTQFSVTNSLQIARVNLAGDNIEFTDLSALVNARNGLHIVNDTVLLGGDLTENTTIDQDGFNMIYSNGNATPSTFTLGTGTNTFNVGIDVGTAGNLTLTNIDVDTTATNILVTDATGNVRTRAITSLVDVEANNGLITTDTGTRVTVQLGSLATGGAPLLASRFVTLNSFDLNFDGAGNMNLGNGTSNVTTNINTGTTGNMTLQGTTLNSTVGVDNFAFVNTTTNVVHRAGTLALDSNAAPDQYITIDNTGRITRSQSPVVNFLRGQIAGTGVFQYTSPAMNIQAGAAINVSVENHTGEIGAIVAQVTTVTTGTGGTFQVETSENIQSGSFINYTVINP